MSLDADVLRHSFTVWRELSGASRFRSEDVKDPFGLVFQFWTPDGASAHLRERFSWAIDRLLKEFDGTYPAPERLVHAVLAELNLLLEGPCFYEERLFAAFELTDETRCLLKHTTDEVENLRLKRLLLEAACWPALARSNSYKQNWEFLVRKARPLMAGKVIRGEAGGEAHFTPEDVVKEVITKIATGKPVWEPERGRLLPFACWVMRSYVDHELNKSGNKIVESTARPVHAKDEDGSPVEDETRFSDGGQGRKTTELAAELADMMERLPPDSLERGLWEAIVRGNGNEKLPELAVGLGVDVKELRKAKANIERMLTQLNYFKRRAR